jgi:hypothetical protein
MDQERADYTDERRPSHEPTLADQARLTPDFDVSEAGPVERRRVPRSVKVAFVVIGVFLGSQKMLAEATHVERLGRPWSLVVPVAVSVAVFVPSVTFIWRRLQQADAGERLTPHSPAGHTAGIWKWFRRLATFGIVTLWAAALGVMNSDVSVWTKVWALAVIFTLGLICLGVQTGRTVADIAAKKRSRDGPEADYDDRPPDA